MKVQTVPEMNGLISPFLKHTAEIIGTDMHFPPLAETKYGLIPFFLKKLYCSVFRAVILTTTLDHQRANNQICLMISLVF